MAITDSSVKAKGLQRRSLFGLQCFLNGLAVLVGSVRKCERDGAPLYIAYACAATLI